MTRILYWILFVLFMSTLTNSSAVGASRVPFHESAKIKAETRAPLPPVISEVLLSAVGDCTIGTDDSFGYYGTLPAVLHENRNDYSYFFKNVVHILENDDITVANLETTLTNTQVKADKTFRFRGPPEYALVLVRGSVEAVNLSNNHSYDYLEAGFQETRDSLAKHGVGYFGEDNVWVTEVQGQKFGFLGYLGFYYTENLIRQIAQDIARLKEQGCTVVVNFHWGVESIYYPDADQTALARQAIENGADLVLGHHPHVIQGVEAYKGKFICYSLGNFCFGGNMNPSDKDTFIAQIQFIFRDGQLISCGLRVIPCSISSVNYRNDYCPTPLEGIQKERVLSKLNGLALTEKLELGDQFVHLRQDL